MAISARECVGIGAVDLYVRDSMCVVLGTGNTVSYAIKHLGKKVREGKIKDLTCVCTSRETEKLAKEAELICISVDEFCSIEKICTEKPAHLAIDGADYVHLPTLSLLKGKGGALLREKLLEEMVEQFVVVVDDLKLSHTTQERQENDCSGNLGSRDNRGICTMQQEISYINVAPKEQRLGFGESGVPVDVVKFGWRRTAKKIQDAMSGLGYRVRVDPHRKAGGGKSRCGDGEEMDKLIHELPMETDDGNYVVLVTFEPNRIQKEHIQKINQRLLQVVGVVETGIFLDMASKVLVGQLKSQVHILA